MQIPSALNSALYAIQKGLAGMEKSAEQIASADAFNSQNPAGLAQPLVELQNNRMQIEVSAKVMKSLDDTTGTLLDIIA